MNKRLTILLVSISIIIIILSLFFAIPKENWSVMPYILSPLLLAALVAVVFSTIHLIKKTPMLEEKDETKTNEENKDENEIKENEKEETKKQED